MTLTFLAAVLLPSAIGAVIVLACVWMARRQQFRVGPSEYANGPGLQCVGQAAMPAPNETRSQAIETSLESESQQSRVSVRPDSNSINYHQIRREILVNLGRRMKGEKL